MIAPRHRKAVRDLARRPGRALLTVIAMAAGIVQIGIMLNAYALLRPELAGVYARTRPASATLVLDHVSDALVDSVRAMPGVAEAEARPVIVARVRTGPDEWTPALIDVVRDFGAQRVDLFTHDRGAWPPAAGEVLLERTALDVARVELGDTLLVRTAGGTEQRLRVAGTVHAPGLPPAWMEHMVPAFVGPDSRLRDASADESAQLRIVAEHPLEEGFIRELADSVRARLERQGHTVSRVNVPTPGRHPHAAQMEAFLFLLLAFGLLSFALSTVLVATLVHALMGEQLREVGILKTLGATSGGVATLYQLQVAILAGAALLLGIPIGAWAGRAYATFSAGILNTDVSRSPFPWWVVAVELLVGFGVPALVALAPLRRAARISVRQALEGEATSESPATGSARLAWLSRPLALSLRALLQRRARLAITVAMLATGSAVFLAALNVGEDWQRSVEADFARRGYDLMVGFSEPLAIAEVRSLIAEVPGVRHAEFWPGVNGWIVGRSGVASRPASLVGPGPDSRIFGPELSEGRWLSAAEPRGAVLNQAARQLLPGLSLGDSVRVRLAGRTWAFRVIGFAREIAPMPVVYAPRAAVLEATGSAPDRTRSARLVLERHDARAQREAAAALERACDARGIGVSMVQRMLDAKQSILDHLVIILSVLMLSSLVVVCVGGLGLTTSLTLGVVQRTREFGILSAIGARPAMLASLVWFEAVCVALVGFGAGAVLTVPVSWALEQACGRIFLNMPLAFWWSPRAALFGLGVVLALATLASLAPARRASRLTVREALGQS